TLNGPPYDELRRHVGMLTANRLKFLEQSLDESGDDPVIIALHHHPFQIGLPGMDVIRLLNGPEFLEMIGRYPNVQMILFGHNHRQISGVSNGIPFACFKSLGVQTPLNFEKLDPSGGITEPPTYGVVLMTKSGVLVHQEDYLTDAEPYSDFPEQLAQNPQMAAGFEILSKNMLLD
ncbi:MAG: metallophosphoesterase, partial [Chloroflexota bacterium]